MELISKVTDAKGRIALGAEYAGKTFLIEKEGEETIILRFAEVVPAREAWLWKNKKAFDRVMEGIDDARKGKFKPLAIKKNGG
ncbi:MAG: hypothetical protein V2B13_06975 [Pseudomonadota bacterium]